jgi:hypothetical protein
MNLATGLAPGEAARFQGEDIKGEIEGRLCIIPRRMDKFSLLSSAYSIEVAEFIDPLRES